MAKKTDTTNLFRIVALLAALALLAAAGLVYLAPSGGGAASAELAALSQAIPARTANALAGRNGAFDDLERDLGRMAELRRASGAPGNTVDWQQLESRASAILGRRTAIEATSGIRRSGNEIVQISDELLTRSGSTAVIQEMQQRANDIASAAAGLRGRTPDRIDRRSREACRHGPPEYRPAYGARHGAAGSCCSREQAGRSFPRWQCGRRVAGDAVEPLGSGRTDPVCGRAGAGRMAAFERQARDQGEQNERNQQAILRLLDEMGSLADGDLTVEATVTEDITGTIADSFNYAIEELRKLVTTVNETAIMVDSAAKQTESAAVHMSRAADNQAREINAATESIVSMAHATPSKWRTRVARRCAARSTV
jgi:hypothetical protein